MQLTRFIVQKRNESIWYEPFKMYAKYVKHFLFVGFWVLMALSSKFMV